MDSRAKFLGHSLHQQLIPFALGPLFVAVIFDIIHLATGNGYWSEIAFWMMAAGLIGAVIAAPFGTIDWMKIPPGTRAKGVGAVHGVGNVIVVVLFLANWMMRRDDARAPETFAYVLSFAGALLSGVTAWLGGELVGRLGVGVDEGANLNAPNSLSGHQPAAARTGGD